MPYQSLLPTTFPASGRQRHIQLRDRDHFDRAKNERKVASYLDNKNYTDNMSKDVKKRLAIRKSRCKPASSNKMAMFPKIIGMYHGHSLPIKALKQST